MISGYWVWAAWLPVAAAVIWVQSCKRAGWWRALGVLGLVTYAFWIASQAFFPMPFGPRGWAPFRAVNMVPLRDLVRSFSELSVGQIVRQHGGNLLLLMPFTLLGPALWPRLRAWRWALALGVGISVLIELLQLAFCGITGHSYRSVDIDDIIVNTAGAMFGYALFVGARALVR